MWKEVYILVTIASIVRLFLDFYLQETQIESDSKSRNDDNFKVFTLKDLKNNKNEIHLSILGSVFDVSKGAKHYKPGGSYEFFAGIDGSRAYVTGDFKNDLTDKVDDLSESQIGELFKWKNFYDTSYTFLGVLEGRFYDSNGQKTEYLLNLEQVNAKQGEFLGRFPTCNSEWTQEKGLVKVWCTTESGGIKRKWSGHPRLVYNPNTKQESCACVNENDLNHPNVKVYPKCDSKSTTCVF